MNSSYFWPASMKWGEEICCNGNCLFSKERRFNAVQECRINRESSKYSNSRNFM